MGGHFPDGKQTLLLKAALCDRLEAIRYFVKWLETNQLDELAIGSQTFLSDFMDGLDMGSQRMLPLVIQNLGEDTHPYFKFLIGTRKNYWVKNKQILYRAHEVQKLLAQYGIPSMLVKGLDLAIRFYENIGHRPMNNGNLLIPYKCKEQVIDLIKKGVFKNIPGFHGWKTKNDGDTINLEFEGKTGVDLHWNIFYEYADITDASDFIWRDATIEIKEDFTVYSMSATHALFVNLVHGRSFELIPPFRWVTDMNVIMQKSTIDWNEFLNLTYQFHYKPFIKRAIYYLIEQQKFEFPADFIEKLNRIEISELEEKYYLAISNNSRKYGFTGLLWLGTHKKILEYKLFSKNSDISLSKYLFSWTIKRIKTRMAK